MKYPLVYGGEACVVWRDQTDQFDSALALRYCRTSTVAQLSMNILGKRQKGYFLGEVKRSRCSMIGIDQGKISSSRKALSSQAIDFLFQYLLIECTTMAPIPFVLCKDPAPV